MYLTITLNHTLLLFTTTTSTSQQHSISQRSNMEVVGHLNNIQDYARSFKDTRLSSIKHPAEFFNWRQFSRPKDMQEYMKRASYNMYADANPSAPLSQG